METRILIVDDEVKISSIMAQTLAKEGYSCVTANNGREALNYFLKDTVSLIITDINMPEMNGMELLKSVKTVNPNMMVIMMTGYPEIDMAVEAIHLGAYDFILKPAELDLVILSVKNALEKKRLEEGTVKLQDAYRYLKKSHLDSVKALAGAIEAKDPYTRGHSDRVSRMSVKIGMKASFSKDRLESLEYGALLHDIGKIGIKDEILQKEGHLSSKEYQHIQEHPLIAAKIVEEIDFFNDKVPMIRHHHEHFDGSGYPDGLAGEAIPL
jgi:response regulator RpfG family c-di-GMP phosphodiesterase